MRRKAQTTPSNVDFRFTAHLAESYMRTASPAFEQLRANKDGALEQATLNFGSIACAATLLGFGLELYLKTIYIGLGKPIPDTHDLWSLFKHLPEPTRLRLEELFNTRVAAANPTELQDLRIAIRRTPVRADFPPKILQKTISNILKRSANTFVAWRYIFDSIDEGQLYAHHTLEYAHLQLLGESLAQFVAENDQTQSIWQVLPA